MYILAVFKSIMKPEQVENFPQTKFMILDICINSKVNDLPESTNVSPHEPH